MKVTVTRTIACLTFLAFLTSASLATLAARNNEDKARSAIIRTTPPAPVFDEKERLAELAQRRAKVAQTIGPSAVLILFSAEPRIYANDVDYEYRQENNLYYLTNLKQKGATLILTPGNSLVPEILFLPRRNPFAETWTGHMYSAGEASQVSGIKEIWDATELEPFLRSLRNREPYRPKPEKIFMSSISASLTDVVAPSGFEKLFESAAKNEADLYLLVPGQAESREYRPEQRFQSEWAKTPSGYNIKNVAPVFADLRLRKSPLEIQLMQHAIDI